MKKMNKCYSHVKNLVLLTVFMSASSTFANEITSGQDTTLARIRLSLWYRGVKLEDKSSKRIQITSEKNDYVHQYNIEELERAMSKIE